MSNTEKPRHTPPEAKLFKELREVIEQELSQEEVGDTSTAFQPTSVPLGLESPRQDQWLKETTELPPIREGSLPTPEPPVEEPVEEDRSAEAAFEAPMEKPEPPPLKKQSKLQEVMDEPVAKPEPPPLANPNRVSGFKRICAGIMDQIFVLTLWFLSLVITLKLMTGSFIGTSATFPNLIENPTFLQFAVLEYAALWFCYFAVCIGMLDMTFGMWVWGFRVGYQKDSSIPQLLRRLFRTFFSVLFYAPLAPILFLGFCSKKGRNLLDGLTGTMVYEAA